MAKSTITFDLEEPCDLNMYKRMMNSTNAYIALHCIANEIFRPHRKHGYPSDTQVQKAIDKAEDMKCRIVDREMGEEYNVVDEAIGDLEKRFYEVLERYDVNLDDLE